MESGDIHTAAVVHPTEPRRALTPAGYAWLAALIGWTCLLCFSGLTGGADFEPTDCWVSQTAREMREAGDWLMPRFSGERRMQKSPGAYWAVMAASILRGTPVDEASTRLPNAIGAVLIVLCVFELARRIAGERAAIYAGFACAASTMTLYWSHRGASDLGLTALLTLSLTCLWIGTDDEPPGRRRIVFWLIGYFAAGLAMVYKMPMPLACVGAPAIFYVLLRNRWRVYFSPWHLLGLLLFCLPWLPWAIAVYLNEPTAVAKWRVEFLDRFTGDLPNVEEQKRWFFYFFYLMPPVIYSLPFCMSLPAAIARGFRRAPGVNRDGAVFMLVWFFSLLAFFTASTGKEMRYFLPAMPPLFVLLGMELAVFFDSRRPVAPGLLRLATASVYALAPLGMAAGAYGVYRWQARVGSFGLYEWREVWPPYAVAAGIFVVGACLSAWLFGRRRGDASFAALVGTMFCAWLWIWPNVFPIVTTQRPFQEFAGQLRDRIDPDLRPNIRMIGHQDPRIIWYADMRFPRIIDQLELLRMQGGERSYERERRLIGEEMLRQLRGDETVLLVAARDHFEEFLLTAPMILKESGESMPPVHLWLQTRLGPPSKHYVVFSNRPPPWPEPALTPPSQRLARAASQAAP